jgi:hypothetical protein
MEDQPETCSLLLIVIVQDQDVELAQNALEEINLTPSILPSIGGFLGQKKYPVDWMLQVPINRGRARFTGKLPTANRISQLSYG